MEILLEWCTERELNVWPLYVAFLGLYIYFITTRVVCRNTNVFNNVKINIWTKLTVPIYIYIFLMIRGYIEISDKVNY